jgi:hypothetical protein
VHNQDLPPLLYSTVVWKDKRLTKLTNQFLNADS